MIGKSSSFRQDSLRVVGRGWPRIRHRNRKGFMIKKTAVMLLIAMMGAGVGPLALAAADGEQLGKVHFATSCNEVAQRRFDRALRYQHSFWYRESKEIFEDVLKADPECGIAYWGIA